MNSNQPKMRTWSVSGVHNGTRTTAVVRARTMLAAIEKFFRTFPGQVEPTMHMTAQRLRLGQHDVYDEEEECIAQIPS